MRTPRLLAADLNAAARQELPHHGCSFWPQRDTVEGSVQQGQYGQPRAKNAITRTLSARGDSDGLSSTESAGHYSKTQPSHWLFRRKLHLQPA